MASKPGDSSPHPGLLPSLPDECWLKVMACLEASELSGVAASLSAGARYLSNQHELWVSLMYGDFCASYAQRDILRTWLAMHYHVHPRQLYVYKRREHKLDLEVARTELHQRGEQAREHDRRQRRLRALNFVLVRATHLILCACVLACSVLMWLKLDRYHDWSFYIVLSPMFGFEVFLLVTSILVFVIFSLRSSSGWTFYWNRLRGAIRWLILHTSAWEAALTLSLAMCVLPLLACALEHDLSPPRHFPRFPRFGLPFGVLWLSLLVFVCSLVRKRSFSASCLGSFALLWLPMTALSILFFLRLTVAPQLPAYAVLAPTLGSTIVLVIFVSFLVIASFWLGYRGNRDWTDYAAITLVTLLTVLLPLLGFQLAILRYLSGALPADGVLAPWVLWLSGLFVCAAWHATVPPSATSSVAPLERLTRHWRTQAPPQDFQGLPDTELLLSPIMASA